MMEAKSVLQERARGGAMAKTVTESPERSRRISERWARQPEAFYAEVAAAVDEEMALEAIELERVRAEQQAISDSFTQLWSCQCCGENAGPGAQDGLCPPCRGIVAVVRAERAGSEMVRGYDRRRWVESFLDRTEPS
jgi:rubrerythrin